MKALCLMFIMLISISLFVCNNQTQVNELNQSDKSNIQNLDSMKLKILIGANVFNAILYNNATATAFKAKLPVTIKMNAL